MSSGTKVRQLAARWLLGVLGKLGFVFWVETFFFRLESRSQLLFRVPGRFTCWHWEASGNTGFMVASPCLWGKLQNMSLRHVSKCENWRTSRTKCSFWCSHVSRLESLVFLWFRRVNGGSRKTSPIRVCSSRLSCRFAWQAWHFVTFQAVC